MCLNKWIPVAERLPESNIEVLVWEKDSCEIGFYREGRWRDYSQYFNHVTHWMSLPESPEIMQGEVITIQPFDLEAELACDHIYGFSYRYEPDLVYAPFANFDESVDTKFNYCPLCGEMLEEE